MKLVFNAHPGINYKKYEFPYCIYCIKESIDSYNDIYSRGFLPYSNDLSNNEEIYYLARSVRIELEHCKWNHNQKSILNKFEKTYNNDFLKLEIHPKEKFITDEFFLNWCINNAKNGFLPQDRQRLSYILSRPYLKNIMKISYNDDILAFLYLVCEKNMLIHTWFSFYDFSKNENNFGKWILLKTIEWAKSQNYSFFYIGTCYGEKAFYKLTLGSSTKYFDGKQWNENISELKKHLKTENIEN